VEWSGVEWSGVEWSGVEWSGVEWSGEALQFVRAPEVCLAAVVCRFLTPRCNAKDSRHFLKSTLTATQVQSLSSLCIAFIALCIASCRVFSNDAN
jgi:hypothetical protein